MTQSTKSGSVNGATTAETPTTNPPSCTGCASLTFPRRLHIITYDMHGTVVETGRPKPCRQTGLVMHTHQLLGELTRRFPATQLAITQTGANQSRGYQLRTPDGHAALAQGVDTAFPRHLRAGSTPGKDPDQVRVHYEDRIDDDSNPVYRSLASQYARVIRRAAARDLLLQNINPIVAVLKAEQFGCLDRSRLGALHLTGVIHDPPGAARRIDYLRRRLEVTRHSVRIVAVSEAVRQGLLACGLPAHRVTTVVNGLDVAGFQQRLRHVQAGGLFERVRRRNGLPANGRMILMSARRVAGKGHLDLLDAMAMLTRQGLADDVYVAVSGNGMLDTRDLGYEAAVADAITGTGLSSRVFLLDDLTAEEVVACAGAAYLAVLPSRLPEGFGYANLEAMLAGVPVVTTRHGGPLDYIEHDVSGLLVEPGDPGGLAAALAALVTDQTYRDRIAVRGRRSAQRFTVEAMFDGYAAVINSHDTVRV